MIELEVHPQIRLAEQAANSVLTCRECHRSFRAKSEDQHSVALCAACFHALRHPEEAIPAARIKVLPRRHAI